ncbi:hypothetical protein LTR10_011924 [Elasticomyces elasticus]|nr:hypothetical protein LTR10_011924 [Elasticomyces elasticus]
MAPTHAHTPPSPCDPSDGGVMTPDILQEDLHPTDEASRKSSPPPTVAEHSTAAPSATQPSSTLMTLPEELLLQIFSLVIPDSLTAKISKLNGRYHPTCANPLIPNFRAYHTTTLVSHHFHRLSRTAFFDIYTHECSLYYYPALQCACIQGCGGGREKLEMASLSPRWCQKRDVRKLRFMVDASDQEDVESAVVDLPRRLAGFTTVREAEIFVGSYEHSSRVLALAERLWREVCKWKAGVDAARSGVGLKKTVTLECHDQRVSWDEKGSKQVKGLERHVREDDWEIDELAIV